MPRIEIVSHPLCPHAHRLRIIAAAKGWVDGVEYDNTDLAYATLQETAPQHSPTGELPVLKVDGAVRTTDTRAAAEYLDGVTRLGLVPTDPDLRLTVRGREARVHALLDTMRGMFAGPTPEVVSASTNAVFDQLKMIDADLAADGTTETTMRMDMAAVEPALALLLFFPELGDDPRWHNLSRLKGIGERSLQNPVVRDTLCPDYAGEFEAFFAMTKSAFPATVLGRHA